MTLQFDELMRDTYSSEANFEYGILHRTTSPRKWPATC
jgi:hypothetical protein